jgi:uncharacterized protein (TIGR02271 family)
LPPSSFPKENAMDPNRDIDPDTPAEAGAAAPAAAGRSLPLIEERLRVDRVEVDRGGYRVGKRVELREDMVDEELRRDEVRIERRPIGRTLPLGSAPVPHHDGDTLVIPVLRETVVVEKRLVLVEEVRITRTAVTERLQQPVTLRAEQIEIERLDADAASGPSEKGPRGRQPEPPPGAFPKE